MAIAFDTSEKRDEEDQARIAPKVLAEKLRANRGRIGYIRERSG